MGQTIPVNDSTHKFTDISYSFLEYAIDFAQRSVLFLNILRQRGNQYLSAAIEHTPDVLGFAHEILIDGETLARPVNYWLARIIPPDDTPLDPRRRPFVVVDPRAGHGPGIGGFRRDSEIGVAVREGHPCYFVGFRPQPVPGQTIEDVARAEAEFLAEVIRRHPEAEGKPCVIGNCQAGWAVLMLAALKPDLFGPIFLAGSPLSYWAGVRGGAPMRYSGGLLGGTWATAAAGDLGGGLFDGAWLVANFEGLNPANTLWSKPYRVWANPEGEAERFLGFEKWWGGNVLMTADEMKFITNNLFVGNKLSSGEIVLSDGTGIDLRNIKSPVVVFCSHGDNITPPQQALGWILDLYESVEEIRARGQTILYNVHDSIGHLGIFVASAIARKEHSEIIHNIDVPELLPPGLYEVVLRPRTDSDGPEAGAYVASFEARTLDDIRALGGNDEADERRFAAAARLSEVVSGLYEACVAPVMRATVTGTFAEMTRKLHPLRLQFEMFSDRNPAMAPVAAAAELVRANRQRPDGGNPWLGLQETWSYGMVELLDHWRRMRDGLAEQTFLQVYGAPALQAAAGLGVAGTRPRRRAAHDPAHRELMHRGLASLRDRIAVGGLPEAFSRAVIYVRLAEREIDERALARFRHMRAKIGAGRSLADFKTMIREQFLILLTDHRAAIRALPDLLAGIEPEARAAALADIQAIVAAGVPLTQAGRTRLAEVTAAFATPIPAEVPSPTASSVRRRPLPA